MKAYEKPTIEFIELKPEERLACESGCNPGCCGSGGKKPNFWWWCGSSFPWGWWCSPMKFYNKYCF